MTDRQEVTPYNDNDTPKAQQVGRMFDAIAPKYDLLNSLMTMGMHIVWRNYALKQLAIRPGHSVLDIATGTGDLVLKMRQYAPARIVGADISEGMLQIARRRVAKLYADNLCNISFVNADCCKIPFPDNTFDRITVAYGVRNFPDRPAAYREMLRLLKPAGKVAVIELSEPSNPLLKVFYKLYTRTLIPLMGRIISKDSDAYTYLPKSIHAAPQRTDMAKIMEEAGLTNVRFRSLFPGVVTIYTAQKN